MPRAGQLRVEPGRRLSDRVALGVLTATFPRRLVDEVIEATGRREQRNRLLPAHLTVYYVLAMTLFSSSGYEEVMRSLTEGLAWASDGREQYELPSQVAISKARTRLGRSCWLSCSPMLVCRWRPLRRRVRSTGSGAW